MRSKNGSALHKEELSRLLAHGRRVERGLRKAILQAALEHKRLGLPMVIYEDGKIREVSADVVIRANRNGSKRRSARR